MTLSPTTDGYKTQDEEIVRLRQEVNGLLVENSTLRGVRDQLIEDRAAAIDRLTPLGCENEQLRADLAREQLRCEALALLLYGPSPDPRERLGCTCPADEAIHREGCPARGQVPTTADKP